MGNKQNLTNEILADSLVDLMAFSLGLKNLEPETIEAIGVLKPYAQKINDLIIESKSTIEAVLQEINSFLVQVEKNPSVLEEYDDLADCYNALMNPPDDKSLTFINVINQSFSPNISIVVNESKSNPRKELICFWSSLITINCFIVDSLEINDAVKTAIFSIIVLLKNLLN